MTVLLDSSAWVEYFKATTKGQKIAQYVDGKDPILLSTVNLQELARYLKRHAPDDRQLLFLQRRAMIEPLTEELALLAAQLQGRHSLGLADAATLATAIHSTVSLVTCDNDFRGLPNVVLL